MVNFFYILKIVKKYWKIEKLLKFKFKYLFILKRVYYNLIFLSLMKVNLFRSNKRLKFFYMKIKLFYYKKNKVKK